MREYSAISHLNAVSMLCLLCCACCAVHVPLLTLPPHSSVLSRPFFPPASRCWTTSMLSITKSRPNRQSCLCKLTPPPFCPAYSPLQLLDHITAEFKKVKAKQAELLGMSTRASLAGGGKGSEDNPLDPETPRPPRARL